MKTPLPLGDRALKGNRISFKLLASIFFTGIVVSLLAGSAQAMNSAAVDEVLKLIKAGLGDDGIVAFVKNKNINYDLSSDDIVLLKNQGVSSAALTAMLASGSLQAPQAPAPVPIQVPFTPAPNVSSAAPNVAPSPTMAPSPGGQAPALSADAAYFYQQLSPYGHWILADDNQWYWQPSVATANWQPYADQGHWIYTDSGWYWASDYPWGWAAFHYGRWQLHPLHGWVWLPDRVWGPAWVTWRTSGEYCGWAPLPPGASFDNAGVLVFRGRHVAVDFDFGLDWHHFNFCRVREMGELHAATLRRAEDKRLAFGRTTVINHYTVNRSVVNGRTEMRVINHGIEPARVAAVKGRTVETVRIQELRTPAPKGAHERLDKNQKTLEVYRPRWGDQR